MRYKSIIWITASIVLTSCGDDPLKGVKDFVAEVKSRPPQPIPELKEMEQIESFVYKAEHNNVLRRDPFESSEKSEIAPQTVTKPTNGVAPPDPNRRKEQLEQYELDELKMVGTIFQKDTMWGLLLTPNGLFRVKAGNYIGKNNGQINRITENKIEITEIVADQTEGWIERQAATGIVEKEKQ
jgi:type IV pilus assembly protein PilP